MSLWPQRFRDIRLVAALEQQHGIERLAGRFIGLGVTGSIAAFKAVDLLRLLRAEGADVQVLMTPSAVRFVAPLTLAALSRRHVDAEVLDLLPDGRIGHVVTADAADAILVAPATANVIAPWLHSAAVQSVTEKGKHFSGGVLKSSFACRSASSRRFLASGSVEVKVVVPQ